MSKIITKNYQRLWDFILGNTTQVSQAGKIKQGRVKMTPEKTSADDYFQLSPFLSLPSVSPPSSGIITFKFKLLSWEKVEE